MLQIAAVSTVAASGCSVFGVGPCDADPDISGAWTFQLSPPEDDAGTEGIPRATTVTAMLEQHPTGGVLNVGQLVWGTLTSSDQGFFPPLTIPRLMHNNGSKTGAELGCTLRINVPTTMNVTDDDSAQDPLRVSFSGKIVGKGQIIGDEMSSTVIMVDDPTQSPRRFAWTGSR